MSSDDRGWTGPERVERSIEDVKSTIGTLRVRVVRKSWNVKEEGSRNGGWRVEDE